MAWIVAAMVLVVVVSAYAVFLAIVKWILSDGPKGKRLFGVPGARGSEDESGR